MKRAKATDQEKKAIKRWLNIKESGYAKRTCPFDTPTGSQCILFDCWYVSHCKKFFPKLKNRCPCQQFSLKYVRRVARELIKNETS